MREKKARAQLDLFTSIIISFLWRRRWQQAGSRVVEGGAKL